MNLKVLIPVALVSIGIGIYGLSDQIFKKDRLTESASQVLDEVDLVSVYTVAQEITKGDFIMKNQLVVERIREDEAFRLGIDSSQALGFPVGSVANQDIEQGSILTPGLIIAPTEPGYIDAVIEPNRVPYAIQVSETDIIGGLITHGSLIDVVALSSEDQNLANEETVTDYQTVSVSPILMAVKVLKVSEETSQDTRTDSNINKVTLILELSQKQVAKLAIAKNITQLEVHKSLGAQEAAALQANSGDVLPDYRAIVEFRADKVTVK